MARLSWLSTTKNRGDRELIASVQAFTSPNLLTMTYAPDSGTTRLGVGSLDVAA